MSKQAIHRYTASSKAGRKIAAASAPTHTGLATLSKEQLEWNAQVDAKKAAKAAQRREA